MVALNEYSICKLATVTGVDMQTAAATTLFTVPIGKTAYITHVVIRDPSASMADTRRWNYVLAPRTEREWLAMFGA